MSISGTLQPDRSLQQRSEQQDVEKIHSEGTYMERNGRETGEGQEAPGEEVWDGQQRSERLQGRCNEARKGVAQGTPQQPVAGVRDARDQVMDKLEEDESQSPVLLQQQCRHRLGRHPACSTRSPVC